MRYGHNLQGGRMIVGTPTGTTFTNTNVAAIDSAMSSSTLSPHAYTATVADSRDSHYWLGVATDIVIVQAQRLSFGLFLPGFTGLDVSQSAPAENYKCVGSCRLWTPRGAAGAGTAPLRIRPFIARSGSSTVTSSLGTQSNNTSWTMDIPSTLHSIDGEVLNMKCDVDFEFIRTVQGNPMCFGYTIENMNAALDLSMYYLMASLSFERYGGVTGGAILNVKDPVGH